MCALRASLQVICLSFVVIQIVDSSAFFSYIPRVRRQTNSKCERPKFLCKTGECIDGDEECDGTANCRDASDETNSCRRIKCPSFLFACKYGACISKKLVCDGKSDCQDASDENTPECVKIDDASPQCKKGEFRCISGQCIDKNLKCDGKAECDDHSDEIKATCWNIKCPGYAYRCDYGSCVDGTAECNGIVECFDGSDENPAKCKATTIPQTPVVTKPSAGSNCVLPQYPQFGTWILVHGSSRGSFFPGMFVSRGTVLKLSCEKSYKFDGNNVMVCESEGWSSELGHCLKTCSPRLSTKTLRVTCVYKNSETENCTNAVEGTLARFKCVPFYEDLSLNRQSVHICHDGEWDQPKPNCLPVCGQKTVEATPLLLGGNNVTKGDYPWQVALYTSEDKSLICGGSLLSQRIVITAAHCITDEKGNMYPKEDYIVAVGKYYRPFGDSRDINETQVSELQAMYIANEYKGYTQNYLGDIAILITKKVFALSRRVQPVCLDSGQNYNPVENDYGYVTGWGFTAENSKPSDVLKELLVPSVSISQCQRNLPPDFDVFLTHDKLCAGFLNKGASVCKGDSGGALVFKHAKRYYITGIVSVSPPSPTAVDGCDSNKYGLYTKVSNYINNFILPKLAEFKT